MLRGMKTTVSRDERAHRYDITVDGVQAGFAEYHDGTGVRAFVHTEIKDEFSGKGLAGILARAALDDTVAAGLRIRPYCPYIASWLKKHEGYEEHVEWPEHHPAP